MSSPTPTPSPRNTVDLVSLLAHFRRDVTTFARHREIVDKANDELVRFDAAAVAEVVSVNADKAHAALGRVMERLSDVERALVERRDARKALTLERVDVEYDLDALELRRAIGAVGTDARDAEDVDLRRKLDDLDDALAAVDDELAQVRRVLDHFYDVGADAAVTM